MPSYIKTFEYFSKNSRTLTVPLSKLLGRRWKVEETIDDIRAGRLSFSIDDNPTVSYVPHLRKYLIVDGHHRIIQRSLAGEKHFECVIYDYLARTHTVELPDLYLMQSMVKKLREENNGV